MGSPVRKCCGRPAWNHPAAACKLVKKTMPYTRADMTAAEAWLDASGVGELLDPADGDAILESLATAMRKHASDT